MRTGMETIRRPRTCVVNHKGLSSACAGVYVGPAFGPSSLAPHLGLRCSAELRGPELEPAPSPARPHYQQPKWSYHCIVLGTGVLGMWLRLRYYGPAGTMSIGVEVTRGPYRYPAPIAVDISCPGVVWIVDDVGTLGIGDFSIVLKPRALALAAHWLEQRGIEVRHTEFFPF